MYKSKDQVTAELKPLLAEPLEQLIALHDRPGGWEAYEAFMDTLAGYYVRGTAQFYNAGAKHGEDKSVNRIAVLKSDIAAAMGHMAGCGHTYSYLEKSYPEFAKHVTNTRKDGE